MNLQAVLWDFGDTLADERWMLAPLDGSPGWPDTYRQVLDGGELADRWNTGSATTAEVAEAFANTLGVPTQRILAHMRACCRHVALYADVIALAARLEAPQAIVTINPDIFSEVVVPACDLTARFAAIVTSWEERTLSKADLCDIAMSRLPGAVDREACLLIDNRIDNVAEWRARGGAAWHFQDCRGLADHLSALL
jgi:phosphoglycolate phosphatase-like HAD superfamily hydrolase